MRVLNVKKVTGILQVSFTISDMNIDDNALDVRLDSDECQTINLQKNKSYILELKEEDTTLLTRLGKFEKYHFSDRYSTTVTAKTVQNDDGTITQTPIVTKAREVVNNNIKFIDIENI